MKKKEPLKKKQKTTHRYFSPILYQYQMDRYDFWKTLLKDDLRIHYVGTNIFYYQYTCEHLSIPEEYVFERDFKWSSHSIEQLMALIQYFKQGKLEHCCFPWIPPCFKACNITFKFY